MRFLPNGIEHPGLSLLGKICLGISDCNPSSGGKIDSMSQVHRNLIFLTGLIVFWLAGSLTARADPASELASFSVFPIVDLAQLATGDAKTVRGAPMSTPRFLSVQTCWVAAGAPTQQMEALRRWNPASHGEMNIFIHANGSDFSRLRNAAGNSAVQSLVSKTQELAADLQISKAEAAISIVSFMIRSFPN